MVSIHTYDNALALDPSPSSFNADIYQLMSSWYMMEGDRFNEYRIQIRNYRETPRSCEERATIEVDEEITSRIEYDTTDAYWEEPKQLEAELCGSTEGQGLHEEESVDIPSVLAEPHSKEREVDTSIDDIPLIEVEWT